jgi:subtilase family protein/putative Ig domain-containing protein
MTDALARAFPACVSRIFLAAAFFVPAVMAVMAVTGVTGAWADANPHPHPASFRHQLKRNAAKPSESSRFLPAEIRFRGKAQEAKLRAWASRLPCDSTRTWRIEGDCLRLSYDLLQDLSGGDMPVTGRGMGDRLSAVLARSLGEAFPASGSAFATYLPDDEWLSGAPQWGLKNTGTSVGGRPGRAGVDIAIEKVWDKFSGSDSLVVAVIDAGYDFRHPDMRGRNWINKAEAGGKPGIDDDANGYVDDSLGWDFVENDNLPQDCHGHGTFVSSVIAAGFDNHQGIAGILAQGRVMPIRVLDASGHGKQADIAKGILYAVRNGARAVNFSIGGDWDNAELRNAFQSAHDAGVPMIVAAGNDAQDINLQPAYPASYTYDNMLVVAAHDHAGLLCAFSNIGKTAVHLAAPGEAILVAGIPEAKTILEEDFEAPDLRWISGSGGAYALSTAEPVGDKQSLAWVSGNTAVATSPDTVDLTGVKGGSMRFRLEFKPAAASDVVIVEGRKIGASIWTEIAVIGGPVPPAATQSYGLQDLDGSRFILRFRTALSSRLSSAARILKIDDIAVAIPDPDPPSAPVYSYVAGTSVAAPYVTAYVGLQRLACDRMGMPWTRALALAGTVPEAALAGKMSTGGRLDAYKGLEFYLSTLPDFRVSDSTAGSWKSGERVEYSLSVSPSTLENYIFGETGLPEGAVIDGAGMLTWTPTARQAGEYTVRLTAEGPTTLRKQIRFTVSESQPVAMGPKAGTRTGPAGARIWTIAGQGFQRRPDLEAGNHLVEVFGTDAAGKVQLLKREWVQASAFSGTGLLPYAAMAPGSAALRLQVRLDGVFLASAR